jgi:putative copper resistance protein D
MLALTVVGARLAQFACAMILLGCPLLFLYGLPAQGAAAARTLGWPRPLLLGAAIGLALATILALSAQTAVMTDTPSDALRPDAIAGVIADTQFGRVSALRLGLALAAGLLLRVAKPSRGLWLGAAVLGAGIAASFAWTGHGAADEGAAGVLHLVSDVLHLVAAGIWIGALVALSGLLLQPGAGDALHGALKGFSGLGSLVVAVILATGLVNTWFLVGPAHLAGLVGAAYGRLLLAKVAVFLAMLGLAAANRFRLTPRLGLALRSGVSPEAAIAALRRSVLAETAAALLVLLLVSLLGMIAPLSAQ